MSFPANVQHAVRHFINKFTGIPDERWNADQLRIPATVNPLDPPPKFFTHCALGHCGALGFADTDESLALRDLAEMFGMNISKINDGTDPKFTQSTPKARVLAALGTMLKEPSKS